MPKKNLPSHASGTRPGLALAALLLLSAGGLAENAPALPPVVERYEQMLVRSPEKGTAFDKVYQHFFENEGLEKLAARWRAKATGENEARFDLLSGLLLERQGNAAEARKAYARAAELTPGNFRAWKALGELEAGEGKLAAAIDAFQKALAANPPAAERAPLYRQLAQSQQRNLDAAAALDTWQKMATEFPDDPFVLQDVADAQMDAEKFDEAKATYTRLRNLAGSDPFQRVSATIHLAQVEERRGKPKDALAIYENALPEASETSWIHREVRSRIEEIYRRQDDLPGLVAYYEKWIGIHDKDVEAATRLSAALVELNRKKEAAEWLQKAAEWAPDRREVQVALAKMLRQTDQADAAIKILSSLTRSFPEELSYWELLGETEWERFQTSKDPAHRKAALAAWSKLAPPETKDATSVTHFATLLRGHDLSGEALAEYERASRLAPGAGDLREQWAGYLFELKRDGEAWKVLDGLVAGEQANAANYQRLATLQNRHDKPEAALESIHKGLALDPKNFSLLSLEWRVRADRKEWAEAAALFAPMLAAAPAMYEQTELQYLQALQALEKLPQEREKLAAKLPAADEGELRLLARMDLQSDDLPAARKTLDEAAKRFPASFPLALLNAEYEKRSGNLEGRVAALRRLMGLEPKQANDFLREIARAYQEESKWDEALAAAQEWIKASPANTEARLFYADLNFAAEKPEQGIATLREAVKLSDKPNQVRQRLARAYLETGDLDTAQQIDEEAFEAEEDPSAKLGLLRQLSELYFQQGKIETLLARFRERQHAEEGGWRYALYLAEIYQQMQDYGQAREELAKALASRPRDPALLKQLIKLAEAEDNPQEQTRYYKALVEVEPSVANRASLAGALAAGGDSEGAIEILVQNQAELLKDPAPWRDVFTKVQNDGKATRLSEALEEALRQRPDDFKGRLTLAEIQISLHNLDDASRILWDLRDGPRPAAASAAPSPAPPPGMSRLWFSPFAQRLNRMHLVQQTFAQLLESGNGSRGFRRYQSRRYFGMQPPPTPGTFQETADTALIYLAAIALQQEKAEAFLARLDKELVEQNADRQERLFTYALVQARAPLWREIKAQVESPSGGFEADEFCLGQLWQFAGQPNQPLPETAEATALIEKLTDRIVKTSPKKAPEVLMMRHQILLNQGKKEEGKKLLKTWLATVDTKDNTQLQLAIFAALGAGEPELAERYLRESIAKNPKSPMANQLQWQWSAIAQNYLQEKKDAANAVRMYVEGFKSTLPAKAGGVANVPVFFLGGGMPSRFNRNFADNNVPAFNRFIDNARSQQLRQALNLLKPADALKPYLAAIEKMEVPQGLEIYPRLAVVYLRWWDDQKDAALQNAQKILAENPDDELRFMVAGMEKQQGKEAEAMLTLDQITSRQGDLYKQAQRLLFDLAKKTKNTETGRKVALRLLGLRLPREEISWLLPELKELGLGEKAEQLAATKTVRRSSSSRDRNRTANLLNEYRRAKKETEALGLARSILAQDPLANQQNDYPRRVALDTLNDFKALDAYLADLEKQYEATPDSVRLCLLLAEAWGRKESKKAPDWYRKAVALKPNDERFKIMLADRLQQHNQYDDAVAIYQDALEKDDDLLTNGNSNFVNAYKQAKKLPRLAEILLKKKGSPGGVLINRGSPQYIYEQTGRDLRDENLELAVKVWLKGIELTPPNYGNILSMQILAVDGLVELGRKEEVLKQIDAVFVPQPVPKAPLLGMNISYSSNAWMNISSNRSGTVEMPAFNLLRVAAKLGGLEALQKRIEAGATQDASTKGLIMAIRIAARDPRVLRDLPKFLADYTSPSQGGNPEFLRALSQELVSWPEAKHTALEVLVAVKKIADQNPQNYYGNLSVRYQILTEATALNERETARAAARDWLALFETATRANNGNVDSDQVFDFTDRLIGLDLLPECGKFIALVKTLPMMKNTSYQRQLAEKETELAMTRGEISNPQAMAGLVRDEKGNLSVVWEIRPAWNERGSARIELTGREMPKLDKRFDLEIVHLTPPNTVQRLALIPKAKSRGKWTGKLPASGALQAVLHEAGGRSHAGLWFPLPSGANLLTNPGLAGVEADAAKVAGWEKLPGGKWSIRAGGPLPEGRYVFFEKPNGDTVQFVGEKFPVQKGKDYLQAGWMMFDNYSQIGRRYLDQDGKILSTDYCDTRSESRGKWRYYSQSLSTAKNPRDGQRRIPPKAAFIQPVIECRSNTALEGLYLGEGETPGELNQGD